MQRYRITFVGRAKGAIGIFYQITEERTAANEVEAVLALYDAYEHISVKRVCIVRGV